MSLSDEASFACPECGQDFSEGKPGPKAALGLHRWKAHGIAGVNRTSVAERNARARKRGRPAGSPNRPRPEPAPTLIEEPAEPAAIFDAEPIVPKRRKFWKDWFSPAERTPKAPGEIRPTKPGRPRKSSRTSFAPGGSLLWMGLSQGAIATGNVPVGRALQLQAGIAGEVLDSAVAGSRLDRLVQPFVGDFDKFKDVGMLLSFPLLVGLCDRQPDNPMAATLLEMVVRQNLHALAEGVRRARIEDRKLADTVETLTGIGMDLGENPVHTILSMIFAPVEGSGPTGPVEQGGGSSGTSAPDPGTAPEPVPPRSQAPGPPPFTEGPAASTNGHAESTGTAPLVEPLPFGAHIVTPADVPPGL